MPEPLPAQIRLVRGLLACVVVAGALAFWTVVPVTWLYVTGDLVPHGGTRFVLVLIGLPLTMVLVFQVLSRVESLRRRLAPAAEGDSLPLLEVMLVISAVLALVGLVLWWIFLADAVNPSGPLQPI
ncbi:MAG: hypothetical protein ACHQCI_02605 [Solirubrobacterales bacterium]|jgi:small-conductance mechanosensitive channel